MFIDQKDIDNAVFLETMYERHLNGTPDQKEEVIEELKLQGFVDEALILEKKDEGLSEEDAMERLNDRVEIMHEDLLPSEHNQQ
jgi:hypothetical protein